MYQARKGKEPILFRAT